MRFAVSVNEELGAATETFGAVPGEQELRTEGDVTQEGLCGALHSHTELPTLSPHLACVSPGSRTKDFENTRLRVIRGVPGDRE